MNNPQWIIDLFASIDAMDTSKFVSFMTEDAVFTFGNAPASQGKKAIFDGVDGFFKSIASIKHHDLQTIGTGDYIVVRGNSTYTRHSGSVMTVGFCNVFEMENNLIKNYRIYIDLSQLYAE